MGGNVNLNGGANNAGQVRKFDSSKQPLKNAAQAGISGSIKGLSIFNQANKADTTQYQGKTDGFVTTTHRDYEDGKLVGKHTTEEGVHYSGDVGYHAEGDVGYSGVAEYSGTVSVTTTHRDYEDGKLVGEHTTEEGVHYSGDVGYHAEGDVGYNYSGNVDYSGVGTVHYVDGKAEVPKEK